MTIKSEKSEHKVYGLISILFGVFAVALAGLMIAYWTTTLEPRLRLATEGNAILLAQSQTGILADSLQPDQGQVRQSDVYLAMDGTLLLVDPVTESPFFLGVSLEVDYEVVPAEVDSLDISMGNLNCKNCFPVEVPLYSRNTDELLGIATYQVSSAFFENLKDDLKDKWIAECVFGLILLAIVWILVIYLVKRLHRQTTGRKQAEMALWEHERKYHRLVNSLSNYFVYTLGANGEFTHISTSISGVLGYSPEEVGPDFKRYLTSHPMNDRALSYLDSTKRERRLPSYKAELRGKDGNHHTIEFSDITKEREDGNLIAVEGIAKDITEQRQFEEELRNAKEEAEAANNAKSRFLANMSHEIRTPMNAILGFTGILREKEEDAQKKHYLDNIFTSSQTLLTLINDILDLSKVEAGKLDLQYSSVSLNGLFEELNTVFKTQIQDKGLEFGMEVAKTLPPALVLDEIRLRQILINLMSNAIKFTDSGFIRFSASFSYPENTHSQVELTIKIEDSGIGIPKEQQEKIFGAFEQATGQKVKEFGGTGLGLTLSKHLVEMMGGNLGVISENGDGATFIINLPNVEIAAGIPSASEETSFDISGITFEPASILIADDLDYNREILRTYLENFDFTFFEAANGQEALDQISQQKPDIILLDMKMPVMDGYEFCRQLRQSRENQCPPIIGISASALKEDEAAIREICDSFLPKPVTKSQLVLELMEHLPNRQDKDEIEAVPLSESSVARYTNAQLEQLINNIKNHPAVKHTDDLLKTMSVNVILKLDEEFKAMTEACPQSDLFAWYQEFSDATMAFDLTRAEKLMLSLNEILPKLEKELENN